MSVAWFGAHHAGNDPARDKLKTLVNSLLQLETEVRDAAMTSWYSFSKEKSETERTDFLSNIRGFITTGKEVLNTNHVDSKRFSNFLEEFTPDLTSFLTRLRSKLPKLSAWALEGIKDTPVQKAAGSPAPTLAGAHAVGNEVGYWASVANQLQSLRSVARLMTGI
jgi:hypothetical protein